MARERGEDEHMPAACHRHPRTAWAVETEGIILLRPDTGAVSRLGYPEAAVWDLLARGYPVDRIVALAALIAAIPRQAAEQLLRDCLTAWARDGFLLGGERRG